MSRLTQPDGEFRVGSVRRAINRIAQVLALCEEPRDEDDFRRASNLFTCTLCGEPYWRHARDPHAPFLTMLCDGDRVKL